MIFNGHSDILSDINIRRLKGEKDVFRNHYYEDFRRSGVTNVIFVIWTDLEYLDKPQERTKQIIESMVNEFSEASDILNPVREYKDLYRGIEDDKINVLIGMEGLSHIENNIDLIERYYKEIGLRHASLTWNEKNALASGASNKGGITKLGEKAIQKIEELGILLDVSHLNEQSFWDLTKIASGPIIASHSNSRQLVNVERNLDDQQLLAIAKSGGLVGINAVGEFVSGDKRKRNIDSLIDHIDHMRDLIGIEHLAFGFDFCDFLPPSWVGLSDSTSSTTIEKLSSEADILNLINQMRSRGYSEDQIQLIAYENYYNLLKKII